MSSKKFFCELLTRHFQIGCYVGQDLREGANLKRVMRRNRRDAQSLSDWMPGAYDFHSAELLGSRNDSGGEPTLRRRHREAFSNGDSLVLHKVQPDDSGLLAVIEVAGCRVAKHCLEFVQCLGLRKDEVTEGTGF